MQSHIHFLDLVAMAVLGVVACVSQSHAAVAGKPGRKDLMIAGGGKTDAVIVVSSDATFDPKGIKGGTGNPDVFEGFAADELARCIELMTGARPVIADTPEAIGAALKEKRKPVLLVGREALKANRNLMKRLKKVAKPEPVLRADAIVVERDGNRVYLAGLTPDGHVHAVVELLHRWGCRWYLPTEFGECIPEHDTLTVGKLDYAYASPFELRTDLYAQAQGVLHPDWQAFTGYSWYRTEVDLSRRDAAKQVHICFGREARNATSCALRTEPAATSTV